MLDDKIEHILRISADRLTTLPMANHLKRHLLCVFLCGLAYNAQITISYLESYGYLPKFLSWIFELSHSF